MSLLTLLPLSQNKLKLLLELYAEKEDYLRSLERKTKINPSLLHRMLGNLIQSGVIIKQKKGKEVYYSLTSVDCQFWRLFLEIYHRDHILEINQDLKVLYQLLLANKKIFSNAEKIYIFGSQVSGGATSKSDIDLLFVGGNKVEIIKWCREVSIILGKELSPLIYTLNAFQKELDRHEPLLTSIINNIKNRIMLK